MGLTRRRKYWGWGFEDERIGSDERDRVRRVLATMLGLDPADRPDPPPPEQLSLRPPRIRPPEGIGDVTDSPYERVVHAAGKSFPDVVRMRRGQVDHPPDLVAFPESTDQVAKLLRWAAAAEVAAIPFGGGTSVVGGVEPDVGDRFAGTLSLDLTRMNRVLEVDEVSRLVHAEAGIYAPDLDARLKPHRLSTRHYPQSYYFSTLGGWIATRSGGHYSTLLGKIDDRVAGLEVVTADGDVATIRPLPGGSIGPDPLRLWIGSEGALGVLTKAWLRVVAEPQFKRTTSVTFPSFELALEAARAIVQAGLYPAHLRVLDPFEAMVSAAFSGGELKGDGEAQMILGFESAAYPVDALLRDAQRIATRFRGVAAPGDGEGGTFGGWRETFFRQPYLRDLMIEWGLVVDTFETAVPWKQAQTLYNRVRDTTQEAVNEACGAGGVLGRTTHAYPDGVAFYFSFFGPARPGEELDQWRAIKTAATDAVLAAGGTASHHHACGRDHAPWAAQELPATWRRAFRGAKHAVDARGILNPGVIFPPEE